MRCPWLGGACHGRPPSCPPQWLTSSPQGFCGKLLFWSLVLYSLPICGWYGVSVVLWEANILYAVQPFICFDLWHLWSHKSNEVLKWSGSCRVTIGTRFYQSREKKEEKQLHDFMWRQHWFQCSSKPLNGRYNGLIAKTNGNGWLGLKTKGKL